MGEELNSFIKSVKKVNYSRKHSVNNSYGVYDAYKWIRKNKWLNIGRALTEHEFYKIIRSLNVLLAENLVNGEDIKFPYRMGRLELRKYDTYIKICNNKLKSNLPINWNETIKLWYEDEEAYKNKTLVKKEEKEIFKVYYNRHLAHYNNKAFFEFNVNRKIKEELKNNIREKTVDAFKFR